MNNKSGGPNYPGQPAPTYGFNAPPSAPPPSYAQAVGGVAPSSPYVPPYQNGNFL